MRDFTIRTAAGAVDIVPFLRRDETRNYTIKVHDWERKPAALALLAEGWEIGRVSNATGLNGVTLRELIHARTEVTRQ